MTNIVSVADNVSTFTLANGSQAGNLMIGKDTLVGDL
jgi:hypothetical protein